MHDNDELVTLNKVVVEQWNVAAVLHWAAIVIGVISLVPTFFGIINPLWWIGALSVTWGVLFLWFGDVGPVKIRRELLVDEQGNYYEQN